MHPAELLVALRQRCTHELCNDSGRRKTRGVPALGCACGIASKRCGVIHLGSERALAAKKRHRPSAGFRAANRGAYAEGTGFEPVDSLTGVSAFPRRRDRPLRQPSLTAGCRRGVSGALRDVCVLVSRMSRPRQGDLEPCQLSPRWTCRDLNPGPLPCRGSALPTAPQARKRLGVTSMPSSRPCVSCVPRRIVEYVGVEPTPATLQGSPATPAVYPNASFLCRYSRRTLKRVAGCLAGPTLVDLGRIERPTSAMRTRRSPN